MKLNKLKGILILVAGVCMVGAATMTEGYRRNAESNYIRIQLDDYHAQMKQLQSLQLDIAGVNIGESQVDVITDEAGLEKIRQLGFAFTDNNLSISGLDADYKTPDEVEQILKQVALTYPQLVTMVKIGESAERRSIWALKLTAPNELKKPAVLFNSMHHAREVMTPEVALDIVDQLTKGFGVDAKVTGWMETLEIWVVPMLNVDGNNRVWTKNSWWRKNTNYGHGVDINRNYPYAWGSCNGSSGSTSSDTYRGPSAGSEPETKALMGLVDQTRPVFNISFHSYSEIVIYPYGCDGKYVETKSLVEPIAQKLGGLIKTDNGKGVYEAGTAWELLYSVDGGDIDWMYNQFGVIPFVIEVNSASQGFQPSYQKWTASTLARVRPGWQYLLDRTLGSSIAGVVAGNADTLALKKVSITGPNYDNTVVLNNNGSFYAIVNPGMYTVSVISDAGVLNTQQVEVKDSTANVSF
jgi:carboxypeptidase T